MDALVGELTLERLLQWRDEHAGQPNAGSARALIKSYRAGHATLEQVVAAVGEYERITEKRETRRAGQVWVSSRFPLVDGQTYENVRVWQPGRGEFTIPRARFVLKAARGRALYHVMSREEGDSFSSKRGSFEEVS